MFGARRVFSSLSYGLLSLRRCERLTNNIGRTQNCKAVAITVKCQSIFELNYKSF